MRVFLIVLDGVGMGALPDAADYGDEGSNTLLHVAEAVGGLRVPALERLGLGSLIALPGVGVRREPLGARGSCSSARSPLTRTGSPSSSWIGSPSASSAAGWGTRWPRGRRSSSVSE